MMMNKRRRLKLLMEKRNGEVETKRKSGGGLAQIVNEGS